jgi:hypothetical protein
LKGHDFSRANKANKRTRASAPAGCLPPNSSRFPSFPAACQTPVPDTPQMPRASSMLSS